MPDVHGPAGGFLMYSRLNTRDTDGLHPNFRGLGFIGDSSATGGALTAQEALAQAIQLFGPYHLNPAQFQNSAYLSDAAQQIQSGVLKWNTSACSGQAPNLNLFKTASGLALSTAGATAGILTTTSVISAATGALLGAATMGVGLIVSVIGMIFAHHAAAVARDSAFECSAVPAVNNAFAVIAQAVQGGTATPADAATAISQIFSEYMSAGGASGSISGPSSIPSSGSAINDSPWCNSNCDIGVIVLGACLYWAAQYQNLASQQATEAASAEATSSSTPTAPGAIAATAPLSAQDPGSTSLGPTMATSGAPVNISPNPGEAPAPAAGFSLETVPKWAWIALGVAALYAIA